MADTLEQPHTTLMTIDTTLEPSETVSELSFSPHPKTPVDSPTEIQASGSPAQQEIVGEETTTIGSKPSSKHVSSAQSLPPIGLPSDDTPRSASPDQFHSPIETEDPSEHFPRAGLSPVLDASVEDLVETQPSASPEVLTSTDQMDDTPYSESSVQHTQIDTSNGMSRSESPQPESPTAPVSPISPEDAAHFSTRDSMASIALSDSSLDYDHLSTEQVTDVLRTPRVSSMRGHLRKMSSLEILNGWQQPSRQSTLFDTMKDEPLESPRDLVQTPSYKDEEAFAWASPADRTSLPSRASAASMAQLRSSTTNSASSITTPRRKSGDSSEGSVEVDWQQLDKTEVQEKEDKELLGGTEDESTAFLLARLEQENAKFSTDPKSSIHKDVSRVRSESRPPSMGHLRKLVADRSAPSIRYSLAPDMDLPEEPPPMTELEFWAALVQDYPSTASRLPTLTTTKIRSGIPPPLRGVVWTSMAGARDRSLEASYDSLQGEQSPYEGIINKDVGRSFPGVELFRDAEGEGQKMLGRVLKCFSLHDKDIGYCQGLGFLVGPLLMNMGEREAFCVLVRLMDHYSLRPSFLPSLSGLHMRIYQFSTLLKQHQPELSAHFTELGVEPAYLSQWFLSCFAVTCPLPMLFRIYDVIFAEGANETVMRVAMALMQRNEERMLAATEFEEVMQLLLGRSIWDVYGCNADDLVDDFTALGNIITHTRLSELEREFDSQSSETVGQSAGFLPDVQAAAGRFLGRLWAPSHGPNKSTTTLSPQTAEKSSGHTRSASLLRRSPSKQSISTLNESTGSEGSTSSGAASLASTVPTEVDGSDSSAAARESQATDAMSFKTKPGSMRTVSVSTSHFVPGMSKEEKDMHGQIEDLLTALSEMQREHAQLAAMLQREREERGDDHRIIRQLLKKLRKDERTDDARGGEQKEKADRRRTLPPPTRKGKSADAAQAESIKQRPRSLLVESQVGKEKEELDDLLEKVDERLAMNSRFSATFETKAQLRSTLTRTREQLAASDVHSRDITARLETAETSLAAFTSESEDLRSEVKELRVRVNEEFKSRQKLEHTIRELKAENRSIERKERLARAESMNEVPTLSRVDSMGSESQRTRHGSMHGAPPGGLRELRLASRRDSTSSIQTLRSMQKQRQTLPDIQVQTQPAAPAIPSPTIVVEANNTTSSSAPEVVANVPTPATETPVSATTPASALSVPAAGMWHKRTTSLATKEVLATPEHTVVPEEALLLELVNAKTAEAQARQEMDELKRSFNIQNRRHEAAIQKLRQEMEVSKLEVRKANEDAQAARRAEAEAMVFASSQASNSGLSVPTTPAAYDSDNRSLGELSTVSLDKALPDVTKKTDNPPPVPAKGTAGSPGASAGGGWFWSRRTASTNKAAVGTPPAAEEK